MQKVSKGLFYNFREFGGGDPRSGYPAGRLICGVGDFQTSGEHMGHDYFDECPYSDIGVAPIGFAVLEGVVAEESLPSGEISSRCYGKWRRLSAGELERMGRGLLPFAGETPELDRMVNQVREELKDQRLYAAFSVAVDKLRSQTSREISPYLASSMTGLSEEEADKVFSIAVDCGLFERVPVWRLGDMDDSQVADDLSGMDPNRPDAVEFLVTDSDGEVEVVGPEEITWCFAATAKLRRALAERDGEAA